MEKSTPFKIGVDIDDVLFPTADMIIEYYRQTYGVVVSQENFYSRDPAVWGVADYETAITRVSTFLHSEDFRHHAPIDGAVEGITALREAGAYLVPITGRDDTQRAATRESLDVFFQDLFDEDPIFTNYFNVVKCTKTKGDVCHELGVDYQIDDHVGHINSLAKYAIKGVLFGNYAWGRAQKTEGIVLPASHWLDVPEVILRHRKGIHGE